MKKIRQRDNKVRGLLVELGQDHVVHCFETTIELDQNFEAFCMCHDRFDIALDRL